MLSACKGRMTVMNAVETYREDLKRDANRLVDELIDTGGVTDFSAASRQATAHAMAEAAHTTNRISDRLGAFYSLNRVAELLGGVSRQAVSERARSHRLLRVTTSDGVMVFPAFQFAHSRVRSNLIPLFEVLLGSGADPWTVAYWLTSPLDSFNGRTALEVVDSGTVAQRRLTNLARNDAAAWQA
jgi:hypothetical protein